MYDLNSQQMTVVNMLDGFNRFTALASMISNEDLDQMIEHMSGQIYDTEAQALVDAGFTVLIECQWIGCSGVMCCSEISERSNIWIS